MSLSKLSGKIARKKRKVVGRGNASGHGTYSCRGGKGQTARSGGNRRPGFEGGQTPFIQKLPKLKGFKNPNKVYYQIVNLGQLNIFDENSEVNRKLLFQKKLISKKNKPVKLLAGKGELSKALKIKVDKASKEAISKIESIKGKIELLEKV